MDHQNQEEVQKTLDFIQKDRIIPEDPWFYSRLVARMENETDVVRTSSLFGTLALQLRPILAVMVILVGITGGIFLGHAISPFVSSPGSTASVNSHEEDANAALYREISGSMDEQILLMK